jgi:hypothetical protein
MQTCQIIASFRVPAERQSSEAVHPTMGALDRDPAEGLLDHSWRVTHFATEGEHDSGENPATPSRMASAVAPRWAGQTVPAQLTGKRRGLRKPMDLSRRRGQFIRV